MGASPPDPHRDSTPRLHWGLSSPDPVICPPLEKLLLAPMLLQLIEGGGIKYKYFDWNCVPCKLLDVVSTVNRVNLRNAKQRRRLTECK